MVFSLEYQIVKSLLLGLFLIAHYNEALDSNVPRHMKAGQEGKRNLYASATSAVRGSCTWRKNLFLPVDYHLETHKLIENFLIHHSILHCIGLPPTL